LPPHGARDSSCLHGPAGRVRRAAPGLVGPRRALWPWHGTDGVGHESGRRGTFGDPRSAVPGLRPDCRALVVRGSVFVSVAGGCGRPDATHFASAMTGACEKIDASAILICMSISILRFGLLHLLLLLWSTASAAGEIRTEFDMDHDPEIHVP